MNKQKLYEIRWYGRGGQGAITSARVAAAAAYFEGYKGVTAAPSFGAERRGAPVTASTRFAEEPIKIFSQIDTPDVSVVLDDSLLDITDAITSLKEGGWLICNTRNGGLREKLQRKRPSNHINLAFIDAAGIAGKHQLVLGGVVLVNVPILGCVARATGLISVASIEEALKRELPNARGSANQDSVRAAYEETTVEAAGD